MATTKRTRKTAAATSLGALEPQQDDNDERYVDPDVLASQEGKVVSFTLTINEE